MSENRWFVGIKTWKMIESGTSVVNRKFKCVKHEAQYD